MSWTGQVLYSGNAKGEVLRLDAPISFWGGVNPENAEIIFCLLYTSPSPRDVEESRMPSSA